LLPEVFFSPSLLTFLLIRCFERFFWGPRYGFRPLMKELVCIVQSPPFGASPTFFSTEASFFVPKTSNSHFPAPDALTVFFIFPLGVFFAIPVTVFYLRRHRF